MHLCKYLNMSSIAIAARGSVYLPVKLLELLES
jgi:hypothetical protein